MNLGVFDSGLGGLAVLRNFIKILPSYNYIYLGDNKNIPYGEKNPEEIYRLTCEAIDYLATEKNCSLIILACNTASTVLRRIQQEYLPSKYSGLKVLGVIRPAAEAIIESPDQPVGIMATNATVKSNSFMLELKKIQAEPILYQQGCPDLVPLIESGNLSDGRLEQAAKTYVNLLKEKGVKSILLGCTHYELILDLIKKVSNIPIITEGAVTAQKLEDYLKRHPEIESQLSKNNLREYNFTKLDPTYTRLAKFFMEEVDKSLIASNNFSGVSTKASG